MDGFDQDQTTSKGDKAAVVFCCFFAAQGNSFEAFELAHGLLDSCADLVEPLWKEFRLVYGV